MRVATCTPIDFEADSQFFGRDSGLLCCGFQQAGADCKVIMPGRHKEGDSPHLVRCTAHELADPNWWRSRELGMVILYAWGDPRYLAVAKAIRKAGIYLIQSLDTAGLTTPYGNMNEWWRSLIGMIAATPNPLKKFQYLARAIRDFFPAAFERKRLLMIDCSDRVAVVSPPAAKSIAAYASALGFQQVADKLVVAPHPISPLMKPSDGDKLPKVLVVGRWQEEDKGQKDPKKTMAVLEKFLESHSGWTAEIVGRGSSKLIAQTGGWSKEAQKRLTLTESVPRQELVSRYQSSRILLCCSRFESFHISSAEALCCGCSIVVADHPLLASTGWFTTKNSGSLATNRSVSALSAALHREIIEWEEKRRDPQQIATDWISALHADRVAAVLQDTRELTRVSGKLI